MWENEENIKGKPKKFTTLVTLQEPSDYHNQGIFKQCTVTENIADEFQTEIKSVKRQKYSLKKNVLGKGFNFSKILRNN